MQAALNKSPAIALDQLLKHYKLTQTDAAMKLNITQPTLSRMITGDLRITAEMAVRIERSIGGHADDFAYAQVAADLAKERAKVAQ